MVDGGGVCADSSIDEPIDNAIQVKLYSILGGDENCYIGSVWYCHIDRSISTGIHNLYSSSPLTLGTVPDRQADCDWCSCYPYAHIHMELSSDNSEFARSLCCCEYVYEGNSWIYGWNYSECPYS